MWFHFHVVARESIYEDVRGVECEDLRTMIEHVRAAVAELRAEEQIEPSADKYLLVTSPQLTLVVVLPLVDL